MTEDYPDTHKCTFARVTLRMPDGRTGIFEQSFGYGYPFESVEFMWREGNYGCDCNKRLFLARECQIDPENIDADNFDNMQCGDTIKLVSLEVYSR